ncbi:DNA-binding response regulator, OmpR family, contains REC and winged-helix (wHTH) domain [Psychrobacillus sp. OK028]|uniref:response regulator transcription factor n=1 Tax=Psychrobacillus sp. OK028 TaxID=1884359 RepID=UPI00088F21F4|nr:response regulator transcription factor [Psychrobacillus sp. OK028]SDO16910.1 DNA-binding response regulator, OmpR family, contains REC and winged-helix (wHTH) domain [Psychrobacillus sp. OK028]
MTTILIVDDEREMRKLVELHLLQAGHQVLHADNGEVAIEVVHTSKVDLILLDVMMPEMSGFEVCEKIRAFSSVPIIFLTALDAKTDLVKGLKLGGDDYVIKPFTAIELMARINAIFRRAGISTVDEHHKAGIIKHNSVGRKISVNNEKIQLTLKEYELLLIFMNHEGKAFSREQLLERIWGIDYEGGTRTVDTHIKTLRLKLGEQAGKYIETVWGIGYRFEVVE